MNIEICKKCNKMRSFYYIEKNKLSICLTNDYVYPEDLLKMREYIKKLNEKNTDVLKYIEVKDDNFYNILPELTIIDGCPYKTEHDLYDWNKEK